MKITINEYLDTITLKDVTNSVGDYVVGVVKIVNSNGDIIYKNDDFDTPLEIESPDIVMLNSDTFSYAMPSSGGSILKDTYTAYYKFNEAVTPSSDTATITGATSSSITITGGTMDSAVADTIRSLGALKITSGALAGVYTVSSFDYTGSTATFNVNETVVTGSGYSGTYIQYASITTTEEEKEIVYQPTFPAIDIDLTVDYNAKTLESKDATVYNLTNNGQLYSGTETRVHVITPPSGATYSVTTTSAAIKKLFNIWTNIWQTTVTSSVQWDLSNTYAIINSISGSDYIKVLQGNCSCEMLDCIKNLYTSWLSALSNNPMTERTLRENIIKVSYNYMLYRQAEACGEDTTEYCNNTKAILTGMNCQCDMEYSDTASTPLTSTTYTTPLSVHFVSDVPSDSVGEDGDIAFSDNFVLYQKESGSWVSKIDYTSTSIYTVSGAPSSSLGSDDDVAISDNLLIYKKISGSWTAQITIPKTHFVSGVPSDSLGNDGDIALSDNRSVYTKASGTWTEEVNMSTDNSRTYQITMSVPLALSTETVFSIPIHHSLTVIYADYYLTETPDQDITFNLKGDTTVLSSVTITSGSAIGGSTPVSVVGMALSDGSTLSVIIKPQDTPPTIGQLTVIYTIKNND